MPIHVKNSTMNDSECYNQNSANSTKKKSLKRPSETENEQSQPFKRVRLSDLHFKSKNPLMMINEICGPSTYLFRELSSSGPSHAPCFEFECFPNPELQSPVLAGLPPDASTFKGVGANKQKAKSAAALAMLESIVQLEGGVMPNFNSNLNFTSDKLEGRGSTDFSLAPPSSSGLSPSKRSMSAPNLQQNNSKAVVEKSPAQVLYEMVPGVQTVFTQHIEPNSGLITFKATVNIDNDTYQGEGRSKKIAKHNAAAVALHQKFNMDVRQDSCTDLTQLVDLEDPDCFKLHQQNRAFADRVQSMIKASFCEQATRVNEQFSRRKVISGIVVTRPDPSSLSEGVEPKRQEKVLCVTTGTKCLSGSNLNSQGEALNDCHAEVLGRRCLQRYLYLQILSLQGQHCLARDEWLVVEPAVSADTHKKYRVKPGVKFHLYISSAPCGDSRIFLPQGEVPVVEVNDDHPQRKSRSLLRTKIESGEGTIPIQSTSGIQTWDGVIAGERLLTMSCSDKVCLWNCLGMQGSLLMSLFLKPVYISSLILGSLYQKTHLMRAVFSRAEEAPFPEEAGSIGLKPTCPELLSVTSQDERTAGKSPNFSVNWLCLEPTTVEVITSAKGQTEANESSRLCKRQMLSLFSRASAPSTSASICRLSYSELKTATPESRVYMESKLALQKHFRESGLGVWVSRPLEEEMFCL